MDIKIIKLEPKHADDYVKFFDQTPHDDNIDEHKCYCVCWCSDNSEGKDFSSREKRRKAAYEYVEDGSLQGYFAFHNGRIVGWCNANTKSDCLKCESWRRFMSGVTNDDNVKIKSVFCFTIAPEMKRKGIASMLLERVTQDAARDGFDFVEAYPEKNVADQTINFGGAYELYKKYGFEINSETDNKYIMRKALK